MSALVVGLVLACCVVAMGAAQAVCGTTYGNTGPPGSPAVFQPFTSNSMDTLWLTELDVPAAGLKIVGFRLRNELGAINGASVAVYASASTAGGSSQVPIGTPLARRTNFTLLAGGATEIWDDQPLMVSPPGVGSTVSLWLILSTGPGVTVKLGRARSPLYTATAVSVQRQDSSASPLPRDYGTSLVASNGTLGADQQIVGLLWSLVGCVNESSALPPTASYTPTPSVSCIIPAGWPSNATYEPCVPSRTPNPTPTPSMHTQSITPSYSRTSSVTPTHATDRSLPPAFLDPSRNVLVSLRVQVTSIIFSSFNGLPGFLNDGGVAVMLYTMSVSPTSWSLQAYSLDDPAGDWLFCIFNVSGFYAGMSPIQQAELVLENSRDYLMHGIPVINVTVNTLITAAPATSAASSHVVLALVQLATLLLAIILAAVW